jgi:hypothetical protein
MTQRRQVRLLVAIILIAGLLPMAIGTVIEAMSAGSIQGQEGWSGGTMPIAASVDQIVDHGGVNRRTGTGAWRISNNLVGQPQRGFQWVAVRPGPHGVRWPAVIWGRCRSVQRDAVVPFRERVG